MIFLSAYTQTIKLLDADFARLDKYCEKYPEIKQFCKVLVEPCTKKEFKISQILGQFIYNISGYSTSSVRDVGWVNSLNSFIGNWFLDDFYFDVEKGKSNISGWEVRGSDHGYQNPLILLQAAEDNYNLYEYVDNLGQNAELTVKREQIKNYNFDTSKVEALKAKKTPFWMSAHD